jgi:hypothetical protein
LKMSIVEIVGISTSMQMRRRSEDTFQVFRLIWGLLSSGVQWELLLKDFCELSFVHKDHLGGIWCSILNLCSILRRSGTSRGVIYALLLLSMLLGLAQVKFRGHLLKGVDASCHQHYCTWFLYLLHLLWGSQSGWCDVRNLLRNPEALSVRSKLVSSRGDNLSWLISILTYLCLSQLECMLSLLNLILEHPLVNVFHLILCQRWTLLIMSCILQQLHQCIPFFSQLARILSLWVHLSRWCSLCLSLYWPK